MKSSRLKIKLYCEGSKHNRGFSLFQAAVLCIVMIFWWNALLSVFCLPLDRKWLYTGTCILGFLIVYLDNRYRWKAFVFLLCVSAVILWIERDAVTDLCEWCRDNFPFSDPDAVTTDIEFSLIGILAGLPVLEVLQVVRRRNMGKGLACIILCSPFLAAAAAGYFQPAAAVWLLVMGGVVYFASSFSVQGEKRFFTWKSTAAVFLVFAGAAFLSFFSGKLLDIERDRQDGYYLQMRGSIKDDFIPALQDIFYGKEQTENKPAERESEEKKEYEDRENADPPVSASREPAQDQEGVHPDFEGDMEALDRLGYYRPSSETVDTVTVEKKPEHTVYIAEELGIVYQDNSWKHKESFRADKNSSGELRQCREYPDNLEKVLQSLCGKWKDSGLTDVSSNISRVLSECAVYDADPGVTPQGKDFVEYFLMENKKGFCVHFATAAALMYRYCGYTARYAEGYAVPASAFRKNESGEYEASVSGDMGHAWCQVYNADTKEWVDKEHTPAAPEGTNIQQPAASAENSHRKGSVPEWFLPAAGAAAVICALFFGRAAVKYACRKRKMHRADEKAVLEMYLSMIKILKLLKIQIKDPLDSSIPSRLYEICPEIRETEWEWMYRCVMEIMFYRPSGLKERWRKMRKLYLSFRKEAYSQMRPAQKFKLRFIKCL